MTSVNHQQYASRYAYETSPETKPVKPQSYAQAPVPNRAQPDSTASRQPMTAQQRGQFAAHKGLLSSPTCTPKADPARLAQLSQQNSELRCRLERLVDQFTPIIIGLQKQVADLSQQVNSMQTPEKGRSPANPGTRNNPAARQDSAVPETRAPAAKTPVDTPETPLNLELLTAENDQLRKTIDRLQTQFTAVVTQLQEQLQALSQKIGEAPASKGQVPAATSGAKPGRAAVPSAKDVTPSPRANEPKASTTRNADDLIRENEQLRARVDQMMTEFTQVITQLQQQVAQLSAQLNAQAR